MKRSKSNLNQKGREKYNQSQFVHLPYSMLSHPNFRALKGSSVKVLLELCIRYNGFNNGRIAMSYEHAAQSLSMGKTTVGRALNELEYYGFIKLIKPGHFLGRKASEWEITFHEARGNLATHEWKDYKKIKKRAKKLSLSPVDAVLNSPELQQQRKEKLDLRFIEGTN